MLLCQWLPALCIFLGSSVCLCDAMRIQSRCKCGDPTRIVLVVTQPNVDILLTPLYISSRHAQYIIMPPLGILEGVDPEQLGAAGLELAARALPSPIATIPPLSAVSNVDTGSAPPAVGGLTVQAPSQPPSQGDVGNEKDDLSHDESYKARSTQTEADKQKTEEKSEREQEKEKGSKESDNEAYKRVDFEDEDDPNALNSLSKFTLFETKS